MGPVEKPFSTSVSAKHNAHESKRVASRGEKRAAHPQADQRGRRARACRENAQTTTPTREQARCVTRGQEGSSPTRRSDRKARARAQRTPKPQRPREQARCVTQGRSKRSAYPHADQIINEAAVTPYRQNIWVRLRNTACTLYVGDQPTSAHIFTAILTQMVAKGLSPEAVGPQERPLGQFFNLSGQAASQAPAALLTEEQHGAPSEFTAQTTSTD